MDAVYFQNAHIILHDDAAFRFESTPDGLFTVQLLDTDRSEVPPGIVDTVDLRGFLGVRMDQAWMRHCSLPDYGRGSLSRFGNQFAICNGCSFIRPAGDLSLCCCFPAGVLQADFLGYLQAFTDTPASSSVEDAEGKQRRPFLKRTLIQPPAASPEERDLQALQATEVRNGLECKFSTSTSKVGSLLL